MKIWLIKVGEPLPTDPGNQRLYRCGIIAQMMADAGHDVTWWTSTFNHVTKNHRHSAFEEVTITSNYRILQLYGCGYRRNVSISRILNHRQIAKEFSLQASFRTAPDIILCAYPTIELSEQAVRYGEAHAIPVVLDVRDLWPDMFLDMVPSPLKLAARVILSGMYRSARRAFAGASAVIGVTDAFVDWGIAYAGRQRGPKDRVFPMAYSNRPPPDIDIAKAEEYWDSMGVSNVGFTAVFFGALGHQFDIDTVINAARMTVDEGIRIVLCGDGHNLGRYRNAARNLPNFIFPGWVNAAGIQALMRRAHVGIAPYVCIDNFMKNMPNKPIEYLSAGLPILTSLDGNLRRLVEEYDCGQYYKQGDAAGLAQLIRNLAGNETRRQVMAKNARSLFEEEFIAENVYANLIRYLDEMKSVSTRWKNLCG